MTKTPAIQNDKQSDESTVLPTYEERIEQLINEGLTNGDAQGVADMEAMQGLLRTNGIYINTQQMRTSK